MQWEWTKAQDNPKKKSTPQSIPETTQEERKRLKMARGELVVRRDITQKRKGIGQGEKKV